MGEPWFVAIMILGGGILLGTLPIALVLHRRSFWRAGLPLTHPTQASSSDQTAIDSRRIFASLHDEAVQLFTASVHNLRLAQRMLDADHPAAQFIATSEKMARAGITSIRGLLVSLKSGKAYENSLAAKVQTVVGLLTHTAPMTVHLAALPDIAAFPATEEAVAGIIGEALMNAAKHAQAGNVWVDVQVSTDELTVTVRDDGVGFDTQNAEREAEARRSFGLYLLRERARSIGGTVNIISRTNGGTMVEARLPLRREVMPTTPTPPPLWPVDDAGQRVSH